MIFNWICGAELGLETVSKTFSGIETFQYLDVPLDITPLFVLLQTSAGGYSELCAYYRDDQDGQFTMCVSAGGTQISARMYSVNDLLRISCSGGTVAQPARVDCVIVGVRQ